MSPRYYANPKSLPGYLAKGLTVSKENPWHHSYRILASMLHDHSWGMFWSNFGGDIFEEFLNFYLNFCNGFGYLLTLFFSRKRVTVSRENPWPRSYRILASMLWTDSICFPHRAASRGQRRYHKCTLGWKRVFLFPVIKW